MYPQNLRLLEIFYKADKSLHIAVHVVIFHLLKVQTKPCFLSAQLLMHNFSFSTPLPFPAAPLGAKLLCLGRSQPFISNLPPNDHVA